MALFSRPWNFGVRELKGLYVFTATVSVSNSISQNTFTFVLLFNGGPLRNGFLFCICISLRFVDSIRDTRMYSLQLKALGRYICTLVCLRLALDLSLIWAQSDNGCVGVEDGNDNGCCKTCLQCTCMVHWSSSAVFRSAAFSALQVKYRPSSSIVGSYNRTDLDTPFDAVCKWEHCKNEWIKFQKEISILLS